MKILKYLIVLLLGGLILANCADKGLKLMTQKALLQVRCNFSKFVSIGNSLTAGMHKSSALYETALRIFFR